MARRARNVGLWPLAIAFGIALPAAAQSGPVDDLPLSEAGPSCLAPALAESCAFLAGSAAQTALLEHVDDQEVLSEHLDRLGAEAAAAGAFGVEVAGPFDAAVRALRAGKANIWATPLYGDRENSGAFSRGETESYGVIAGVDAQIAEDVRLGATYTFRDSDSAYLQQAARYDRQSHALSGFAQIGLGSDVSARVGASHSWSETDAARQPAGFPRFTGSFDGTGWSVFGGLHANRYRDGFYLTGDLTVFYSGSDTDSYVESSGLTVPGQQANLGQAAAKAGIGYIFRLDDVSSVYPSIGLRYRYDFEMERLVGTSGDRDGVELTGGLHLLARRGLSAGIDVSWELGRQDVEDLQIKPAIRWKF